MPLKFHLITVLPHVTWLCQRHQVTRASNLNNVCRNPKRHAMATVFLDLLTIVTALILK